MDHLRIYFEDVQDGGCQSNFLSQFATEDTQGGICFNIVLKWLQLYCANNSQLAPNKVFRELIKQPDTIHSISVAQSAYQKEQIIHSDDTFVFRYGLGANLVKDSFDNPANFAPTVMNFIQRQNHHMMEIGLYFKEGGAHSIGIIVHNNRIYLYDPNVGVMSSDMNNMIALLREIPKLYGEVFRHSQLSRGIITNIEYQL